MTVSESVQRFAVPEHVLLQDLPSQGLVCLNMQTEEYFGLDLVGARMYQALASRRTLDEACDHLAAAYDVPREVLRADLAAFTERLLERGLLSPTAG